jgi:hypothetical protein
VIRVHEEVAAQPALGEGVVHQVEEEDGPYQDPNPFVLYLFLPFQLLVGFAVSHVLAQETPRLHPDLYRPLLREQAPQRSG